jgi:hypothetical protein
MVEIMESESDIHIHSDVRHIVDSDNGDDVGSEETQGLEPPIPQIIGLGVLFLSSIGVIVLGYFHGNMNLLTTLKNAASS